MRTNSHSRTNSRPAVSLPESYEEDALHADEDINPADFLPNEDIPMENDFWNSNLYKLISFIVQVSLVMLLISQLSSLETQHLQTVSNHYPEYIERYYESYLLSNLADIKKGIDHMHSDISLLKLFLNDTFTWKANFEKQICHLYQANNQNLAINVEAKIEKALTLYDADKLGIVDYALESLGGSIISTPDTKAYPTNSFYSIMGVFHLQIVSTPDLIIKPSTLPGQCFAFHGRDGKILIKLAEKINITNFTMEHTHSSLVDDMSSAPRKFRVYGLEEADSEKGDELGQFIYALNGKSLQTFTADKQAARRNYEYVELHILSNYGNPNYTCVYRFRVHGNLVNIKV